MFLWFRRLQCRWFGHRFATLSDGRRECGRCMTINGWIGSHSHSRTMTLGDAERLSMQGLAIKRDLTRLS
jgi:hypothetical protein